MTTLDLRGLVRDIPDFPKPGILFRDITPLMRSPLAWQEVMRQMGDVCDRLAPDLIVGIESRGFIVGTALATARNIGFSPVRKPGKLPGEVIGVDYTLEYGRNSRRAAVLRWWARPSSSNSISSAAARRSATVASMRSFIFERAADRRCASC